MAGQAGVFFFDGRPARIESGWCSAGPGVAMRQESGDVWLGDALSRDAPHATTDHALTWDGRLDNRDDLLLRLGTVVSPAATDAELALAAFERWGSDGLRALVGDWSLVILDRARRRVLLARDYMGARPLYYCVTPAFVAWSSNLGELVERCGRTDDLSDEFAASFMTIRLAPDLTPYEGIRAVPAATCVSFSEGGVEQHERFWHLEPGEIRYQDRRDEVSERRAERGRSPRPTRRSRGRATGPGAASSACRC